MGDPKTSRRKYEKPSHPWQEERIKEENDYIRHYGLKNKKEYWKARSVLKNIRAQARNLQARLRYGEKQATEEKEDLLDKLRKKGFLKGQDHGLNDILGLTIEDILNRRLQTLVYHKGLAHSAEQARQFITHGHISIGGRKVTVPSYIVKKEEEPTIDYYSNSPLSEELHPERPEEEVTPTRIPKMIEKEKEKDFEGDRR
ncbi:MAG: 30S ribosomal protein S4 [Candidatus Thermoplasmatota archaeon]|nr:30S ribosomal protein S4 [Candidatus Thermoplasmatota archaeon]